MNIKSDFKKEYVYLNDLKVNVLWPIMQKDDTISCHPAIPNNLGKWEICLQC